MDTTGNATTACHRVLATPELLGLIFCYGDTSLQYRSACVCKAWSPAALDVLWRDMTDLVPLLQVLAPLEPDYRSHREHVSFLSHAVSLIDGVRASAFLVSLHLSIGYDLHHMHVAFEA